MEPVRTPKPIPINISRTISEGCPKPAERRDERLLSTEAFSELFGRG